MEIIMLGPIGSEIMSIFRLLSPDEIGTYIVENKVSKIEGTMTATGEELSYDSSKQFIDRKKEAPDEEQSIDVEKQAKIIPLHAYKEEQQHSEHHQEQQGLKQKENNNHPSQASGALDSIGILSASQIQQQEKERLEKEKAKEDSITVFLLKEREKMRKSKQKITEQTAMKVYKSSAAVDLNIEEDYEDEESSSHDMRGILVNKKHF